MCARAHRIMSMYRVCLCNMYANDSVLRCLWTFTHYPQTTKYVYTKNAYTFMYVISMSSNLLAMLHVESPFATVRWGIQKRSHLFAWYVFALLFICWCFFLSLFSIWHIWFRHINICIFVSSGIFNKIERQVVENNVENRKKA